MARPAKYDWEEITNMVRAGMPRPEVERKYGCSSGRLSEELKKRGIKEPVPELLRAKDALVDAVRKVSEVSESFGAKSSVIAVAAHETGYALVIDRAAAAGVEKAMELLAEQDSMMGVKAFMETIDKATGILEPTRKAQNPTTVVNNNTQQNYFADALAEVRTATNTTYEE